MEDSKAVNRYDKSLESGPRPDASIYERNLDRVIIWAHKAGKWILKSIEAPEEPLTPVADFEEYRKRRERRRYSAPD